MVGRIADILDRQPLILGERLIDRDDERAIDRSPMQHLALAENAVQLDEGGAPAALDRAWADFQQFGDLDLGPPVVEQEVDDLAFFFGQSGYLLVEGPPAVRVPA